LALVIIVLMLIITRCCGSCTGYDPWPSHTTVQQKTRPEMVSLRAKLRFPFWRPFTIG